MIDPGERHYEGGCDDGNTLPGDGCDASCRSEPGWLCADAPCREAICGNGRRDVGDTPDGTGNLVRIEERCDDGNTTDGDGCDANCRIEAGSICDESGCRRVVCGDGLPDRDFVLLSGQQPESCDDGNTLPGDGCDAECQYEPDWVCRTPEENGLTECVPAATLRAPP